MKKKISGCLGLHPATRIFLWICLLMLAPSFSPHAMHVVAIVCLLLTLSFPLAWRFVWRTRFLFLAMGLVLPWTTPGIYAFPTLGVLSPTRQGLHIAAIQIEYSLLMLVSLAVALAGLDMKARLTGILSFLEPLARLGMPLERLAVRLVLTLQWLENEPQRRQWRDWQAAWIEALQVQSEPGIVDIELGRWRKRDYLLSVIAFIGVLSCVGR